MINMAVSSLKGCWHKLSTRIRDYIEVVDSCYRPVDGAAMNPSTDDHLRPPACPSISATTSSSKDKRANRSKHHHHHHHHHYHNCLAIEQAKQQQHQHHNNPHHHQQQHTPRNHHQLPPGYMKRKTAQGQVYFVDSNGHKYWRDPNVPKELFNAELDLDNLIGRLPPNWEVRQTDSGKTYFINHNKRTTQFTDPRLCLHKDRLISHLQQINAGHYNSVTGAKQSHRNHSHELTCHRLNNNKELLDKISILRQELLKQQVLTHPCRIDVNRKRIFEESFRVVSQMQPRDLKKRLLVKFRGEEGLDYGGVAREWFYLLSREILNPNSGLFQYTSDDNYNLQINPDSGIAYREHLSYLNFCGRIIGMAVFHGHFIEGHFTLPFYKMLLRKPITLSDIEFVDPELHRSLCWILDNNIENIIETTFLIQHNAFGQLQEHELKENGRNIVVTEENKHEYVSLYANYRCRRGIERQFEALQRGFYELISPLLLENFDEYELELLIGGLSKIDIEDWRLHTKLKNCTIETPIVIWFWDIVKLYNEDKRARLLQFVTGSPRVPIQGFKALQGVNSELRLFTIHLIRNANTDNLPKSHTCFNRIDLPPYETYEKLRDKLTQAIEETMGFAMQ